MKETLTKRRYPTEKEMQNAVQVWLLCNGWSFYNNCIEKLVSRNGKCLNKLDGFEEN